MKTPQSEAVSRLESWKEIAAYLNCGERTAKRWETTRGLPVYRLPGRLSHVFALREEIDLWRASSKAAISKVDERATEQETEVIPVPQALTPGVASGLAMARTRGWRAGWYTLAGLGMALALLAAGTARLWRPTPHAASAKGQVHTPSQQVVDLYLSGRFYWAKRTPADLKTAMADFEKAASLDPKYAAAYAGIADCYALSPEFAGMPPREAYPKMLVAARRALSLNPNLPEAHRALGFALFHWDWDRDGSRKEFEEAIRLDPNNATTFHWFANVLMESQDLPRALEMIDKARALDSAAPSVMADRGLILEKLGRSEEARQVWRALEQSDRSYLPPHWYLSGDAHDHRDAHAYLQELKEIADLTRSSGDAKRLVECKEGYHAGGLRGLLNADADFSVRNTQDRDAGYVYTAASLYLASREDEALKYLELAYERRDSAFPILSNPGSFEHLVGRPEFDELRSRSQLPYPEGTADGQSTKPRLQPVMLAAQATKHAAQAR